MTKNFIYNKWLKLISPRSIAQDSAIKEYITNTITLILGLGNFLITLLIIFKWLRGYDVNLPLFIFFASGTPLSFLGLYLSRKGHWVIAGVLPVFILFGVMIFSFFVFGTRTAVVLLIPVILVIIDFLFTHSHTIFHSFILAAVYVCFDSYLIPAGIIVPLKQTPDPIIHGTLVFYVMLLLGFLVSIFSSRMNATLGNSFKNLRETQYQLVRSEQLASIGILASGISHEYNNINSIALGYVQLLLEDSSLRPDIRTKLDKIQDTLWRSSKITGSLLSFSKPGKRSRTKEDVNAIIDLMIELLSFKFKNDGITLELRKGDISEVYLNKEEISQVVLNILTNAEHAMKNSPDKKLIIETVQDYQTVKLIISDSGNGIPDRHLHNIFKPFFSTKSDSGYEKDSVSSISPGLGLSVSYNIIKEHHGTIDVESRSGEGTTFIISLPGASIYLKSKKVPAEPKPIEKTQKKGTSKILILDDEEDIRSILTRYFSAHGHTVESTDDGEAALELLSRSDFDIALVDLYMPIMDGTAFMERVAGLPSSCRPEIIAVTGEAVHKFEEQKEALGIKAIITKPFILNDVEKTVKEVLANKKK